MPTINLQINPITQSINVSVQVGDIVYYTPTASIGGFDTASQSQIVKIGTITAINQTTNIISATINASTVPPSNNDYILFSKDSKVNLSSLLGYYAEVTFYNNSTDKAELFAVGCDYFESSPR